MLEKFVGHIEEGVKRLYETFLQQLVIKLTDHRAAERQYQAAGKCHICFKEFNDSENRKVRGYCNYVGLHRGAAHNNCNLKYQIPDHIPIVFHNLSSYDANLFIRELGKKV